MHTEYLYVGVRGKSVGKRQLGGPRTILQNNSNRDRKEVDFWESELDGTVS